MNKLIRFFIFVILLLFINTNTLLGTVDKIECSQSSVLKSNDAIGFCVKNGARHGVSSRVTSNGKRLFECYIDGRLVKDNVCTRESDQVTYYYCCPKPKRTIKCPNEEFRNYSITLKKIICVKEDPLWEEHISLQKQISEADYQWNLISRPCFPKLNKFDRDYMFMLLQVYHIRFCYLLENMPYKIIRNKDIYSWGNAPVESDWTNEDEKHLRKISSLYRQSVKDFDLLKKISGRIDYTKIDNYSSNSPVLRSIAKKRKLLDRKKEKLNQKIKSMINNHKNMNRNENMKQSCPNIKEIEKEQLKHARICGHKIIHLPCFDKSGQENEIYMKNRLKIDRQNCSFNKSDCEKQNFSNSTCCSVYKDIDCENHFK